MWWSVRNWHRRAVSLDVLHLAPLLLCLNLHCEEEIAEHDACCLGQASSCTAERSK